MPGYPASATAPPGTWHKMSAERAGVHLMKTSGAPINGTSLTAHASAAPRGASHRWRCLCTQAEAPNCLQACRARKTARFHRPHSPFTDWNPSPRCAQPETLEGHGGVSPCIKALAARNLLFDAKLCTSQPAHPHPLASVQQPVRADSMPNAAQTAPQAPSLLVSSRLRTVTYWLAPTSHEAAVPAAHPGHFPCLPRRSRALHTRLANAAFPNPPRAQHAQCRQPSTLPRHP